MNKKPRGARERGQRVHGNIGGRKSQGRGPNSAGKLTPTLSGDLCEDHSL